jgi:hypothetical protein
MTSLKDLYYDVKTGFVSENKLYKKAKELGLKVTHKDIKEFLQKQQVTQVVKQQNKEKLFTSIYEDKIRDNYQMDIIIYDRYEYHNYKYILVLVDIYSRYAEAKPMTNRKNDTIMKNIEDIIKDMGKPKKFSCDNEFATKLFEQYCEKNDIDVEFSEPNDIQKNSIVERLNRTIALMIQKYRVSSGSYDWVKILPDLMYNYNHSVHRTIKDTPDNIFNNDASNKQTIIIVPNKFKLNDKVRLKIKKNIFSKGDELTYSKEIFTIDKIDNGKYHLSNGKSYSANKIRKINDIVEYEPTNNNDEVEHNIIQKRKKVVKKLVKEGIDPYEKLGEDGIYWTDPEVKRKRNKRI